MARFFRRRLKDIFPNSRGPHRNKRPMGRKTRFESLVRAQTEAQDTPKTTIAVIIIFKWESETGYILIISWGNTSKLYLLLVCIYTFMMCVHHLTNRRFISLFKPLILIWDFKTMKKKGTTFHLHTFYMQISLTLTQE